MIIGKFKIHPYRIAAAVLGVVALLMMAQFPQLALQVEALTEEREALIEAYYDAQATNRMLAKSERFAQTDDFAERVARRDLDYCWYGETIYDVSNLADYADIGK